MFDLVNIAWLPFIGYSLSLIVYLLHLGETFHVSTVISLIGTIMLVVGYGFLAFAFAQDFLKDPLKNYHEIQLRLNNLKRIGAGIIALFLLLSFIGILGLGLHSKLYDIFGIIGYGLFANANNDGVYFVMLYLITSIIYKWKLPDERENIQVVAKICILTYYILILLF